MQNTNLLIITGQEGSGKTTVSRELLAHTQSAAKIDADDLGQTNPWEMNDKFIQLLWTNVVSLVENFADAGFQNIIAANFLIAKTELELFRELLKLDANWFVIHLCASKEIRDARRIERLKPTKKEWRDRLDELYPE